MIIAEILQKKGNAVATIDRAASIADAIGLLARMKIGAVVVVSASGGAAGIFTERDVVRVLDETGAAVLEQPVGQAMTVDPITCPATAKVEDILEIMSQRHFRHMPVVENGVICGIISIRDLVSKRLEHVEIEAEAMRAYVAGV